MPHPHEDWFRKSRDGSAYLARTAPHLFNAQNEMDALHDMANREHLERSGLLTESQMFIMSVRAASDEWCSIDELHGAALYENELFDEDVRESITRCNKAFANGRRCQRVTGHPGMHCAVSGFCTDADHADPCHCKTYMPASRDGHITNPRCVCGGFR